VAPVLVELTEEKIKEESKEKKSFEHAEKT